MQAGKRDWVELLCRQVIVDRKQRLLDEKEGEGSGQIYVICDTTQHLPRSTD